MKRIISDNKMLVSLLATFIVMIITVVTTLNLVDYSFVSSGAESYHLTLDKKNQPTDSTEYVDVNEHEVKEGELATFSRFAYQHVKYGGDNIHCILGENGHIAKELESNSLISIGFNFKGHITIQTWINKFDEYRSTYEINSADFTGFADKYHEDVIPVCGNYFVIYGNEESYIDYIVIEYGCNARSEGHQEYDDPNIFNLCGHCDNIINGNSNLCDGSIWISNKRVFQIENFIDRSLYPVYSGFFSNNNEYYSYIGGSNVVFNMTFYLCSSRNTVYDAIGIYVRVCGENIDDSSDCFDFYIDNNPITFSSTHLDTLDDLREVRSRCQLDKGFHDLRIEIKSDNFGIDLFRFA